MTRIGDWMQTYSGRQFWPMSPSAEDVEIEDIAHSLSMQCRFAGHCQQFYSVAEHSVHIARWLTAQGEPASIAMWGLLHDAAEAYLVDVPRPVKPFLEGYKEAEAVVQAAVCRRFGLPLWMPAIVKEADNRILADEKARLMRPGLAWAIDDLKPIGARIGCWNPRRARGQFRDMFEKLSVRMRGEA